MSNVTTTIPVFFQVIRPEPMGRTLKAQKRKVKKHEPNTKYTKKPSYSTPIPRWTFAKYSSIRSTCRMRILISKGKKKSDPLYRTLRRPLGQCCLPPVSSQLVLLSILHLDFLALEHDVIRRPLLLHKSRTDCVVLPAYPVLPPTSDAFLPLNLY